MAAIHKENGALEIFEGWGTHIPDGKTTSLPLAVQMNEDETVVIGWIRWPSREVRDQALAKMRQDPRAQEIFRSGRPFDGNRMIFGGVEPLLEV